MAIIKRIESPCRVEKAIHLHCNLIGQHLTKIWLFIPEIDYSLLIGIKGREFFISKHSFGGSRIQGRSSFVIYSCILLGKIYSGTIQTEIRIMGTLNGNSIMDRSFLNIYQLSKIAMHTRNYVNWSSFYL